MPWNLCLLISCRWGEIRGKLYENEEKSRKRNEYDISIIAFLNESSPNLITFYHILRLLYPCAIIIGKENSIPDALTLYYYYYYGNDKVTKVYKKYNLIDFSYHNDVLLSPMFFNVIFFLPIFISTAWNYNFINNAYYSSMLALQYIGICTNGVYACKTSVCMFVATWRYPFNIQDT